MTKRPPDAAVKVSPRQYGRLLATYLGPLWRRAALLAAALAAGIGLELLNPQILRLFIDEGAAGSPLARLTGLAAGFLGVAALIQLTTVAESYLGADIGLSATNRLRADLMRHTLQLDMGFHNARTPGELIERVDGDVATLGNFFSRFVVQMLGNLLLLVGVLALLFGIDYRVGLAMAAFTAASLTVIVLLRDAAVPFWRAAREASASLFGFIEERLAATEEVRANGARAYVMQRLNQRSGVLLRRSRLGAVVGSATGSSMFLLFALGSAAGLGLGAWLYQAGELSLGMVYLIFNYGQLLTRPIEQISRQMQDLQQAGAGLTRVLALLAERSQLPDGSGSLPDGPLDIAFEGVSFSYEQDDPILRAVDFELPAGQVLGLLGRTGSGKTTLTRLLFRLYDPTAGSVRLAGRDLREVKMDQLRSRVGIVTQDIQLFHASLRDNLTFFDPAVDDARIVQVLDDLGLGEWYAALPYGLDTRLAASGGGLSAGQAQLLAFARVFLKEPGVVILDEASSRLDPATEQRLERAIDRLLRGRTVIIIAHRLQTVQRADRIMILEAGAPVEHGPRAALAADPRSRFYRLLQAGLEEVLA